MEKVEKIYNSLVSSTLLTVNTDKDFNKFKLLIMSLLDIDSKLECEKLVNEFLSHLNDNDIIKVKIK